MPKPGRQRKAKRGAKKEVEAKLPAHWVPASEKEERENNKLLQESLRWNTDLKGGTEYPKRKEEIDSLTLKELTALIMRRNLLSADAKIANTAAKNVIAMEQQNQRDQLQPKEQTHNHLHIHNHEEQLKEATDDELLELLSIKQRLAAKQNAKRS